MKSLIRDTLRPSLFKRMIPPLYKDLLIWTNRHYDPATHTIKSRLTPAYDITLKQGLVAQGNGTDGQLDYGKLDLVPVGGCSKLRFQMKVIDNLSGVGNSTNPTIGEYKTGGATPYRSWHVVAQAAQTYFRLGTNDEGTAFALITVAHTDSFVAGDLYDCTIVNVGADLVLTVFKNGVANGTATREGQTQLFNNGANLKAFGYDDGIFSPKKYCCFKIWVTNIEDTDTPKFVAPMGDKTGRDIISGTKPTVVGTVDMTVRDDKASFDGDDRGFAVKSGEIFLKKYSGVGYAGDPVSPDAVYSGLIALKGQIEIAGQALLGTLFDFAQTPNTPITDAGISWDDWDNADCNLDTVGTAETDLDTSYYSAITASLMTCEGMIYGGTSNVAKRLFFRVANKVMKADGSFLASGGIVTEILVYKRDLSPDERLRVMKWCRTFPFTSVDLVVDVNGNYVFVGDDMTYTCL